MDRQYITPTDISHFMDCRRRGVLRLTNAGREADEAFRMSGAMSATLACGIVAHSLAQVLLVNKHAAELEVLEVLKKHRALLHSPMRFTRDCPNLHMVTKVAERIGFTTADLVREMADGDRISVEEEFVTSVEQGAVAVKGRPDFVIWKDKETIIADLKVSTRAPDEKAVPKHSAQLSSYRQMMIGRVTNKIRTVVLLVGTRAPEDIKVFDCQTNHVATMRAASELNMCRGIAVDGRRDPVTFATANPSSILCNPLCCPFYGQKTFCPETSTATEGGEDGPK